MPVHIEYHPIWRYIVALQVAHYLAVVIGRIGGILAVPISEDIVGRKGYASGYTDVVGNCLAIVSAVCEKIDIHGMSVGTFVPPGVTHVGIGDKSIRASAVGTRCAPRVVYYCPAGA